MTQGWGGLARRNDNEKSLGLKPGIFRRIHAALKGRSSTEMSANMSAL